MSRISVEQFDAEKDLKLAATSRACVVQAFSPGVVGELDALHRTLGVGEYVPQGESAEGMRSIHVTANGDNTGIIYTSDEVAGMLKFLGIKF